MTTTETPTAVQGNLLPDTHEPYSLVLEWAPGEGIYVASVPELPGCRAHGCTRAEAVQQIEEVIAMWVESARECGDLVPAPRLWRAVNG